MSRRLGTTPGMRPRAGPAWRVGALAAALALPHGVGCTAGRTPAPPDPEPATETAAMDPVGVYDLTMSSETMVSEGTMEIYGEPGGYEGRISLGVVTGRIVLVEAGEGQLIVQVALQEGRLTLRLAGDVSFLSGNWILGKRRGAVVAKRHEWQEGFARGGDRN